MRFNGITHFSQNFTFFERKFHFFSRQGSSLNKNYPFFTQIAHFLLRTTHFYPHFCIKMDHFSKLFPSMFRHISAIFVSKIFVLSKKIPTFDWKLSILTRNQPFRPKNYHIWTKIDRFGDNILNFKKDFCRKMYF